VAINNQSNAIIAPDNPLSIIILSPVEGFLNQAHITKSLR